MTSSTAPQEDIRTLLLQFLGAYSRVQNYVDEVVARTFFSKRLGMAAERVWKLAVSRIRDDERVPLFLAIADELKTDADLELFEDVYKKRKTLRDGIAHSAHFAADGEHLVSIQRTVVATGLDPFPEPVKVDRDELLAAIRDCSWLQAQMVYVLLSGMNLKMALGDIPVTVPKPARNPDDWDRAEFALPVDQESVEDAHDPLTSPVPGQSVG
ncbi:hypothetical protein [Mycobacteroides immunogenum]|uniref:Uncharacterized protein n=1 Tax=Mycobacteroides immunogenum TaxID=83262 RepID=A0A7V8LKP1_9MYCO|nr:hypothetical protein [Mycobacteroides immunogenum]AMT72128.1 hypothetical protein ABG82_19350 [Mycobacteroides immunogenum]ANO05259.1 hypothetical protein BAB75_19610 [Mycobacteroides immunogenum]KIU38008.1 hypothetical protein TL11_24920 [Mycobacteroides immunogenum]KPG04228.1 hypothetical protein AN909_23415 [Mycobacteroides immunogenum]KPG04854.1 hypothetical protein AN908_23795 [Mycobacteroides immunogenum]